MSCNRKKIKKKKKPLAESLLDILAASYYYNDADIDFGDEVGRDFDPRDPYAPPPWPRFLNKDDEPRHLKRNQSAYAPKSELSVSNKAVYRPDPYEPMFMSGRSLPKRKNGMPVDTSNPERAVPDYFEPVKEY